jgi:hypothetical protein
MKLSTIMFWLCLLTICTTLALYDAVTGNITDWWNGWHGCVDNRE